MGPWSTNDVVSRGQESPSAPLLGALFGEFHWKHPNLRICAGAFLDDGELRYLKCFDPEQLPALPDQSVRGVAAHDYRAALEQLRLDVTLVDPHSSGRPGLSEQILGAGTRATSAVSFAVDHKVVGFVRVDAPRAADLSASALAAMHDLAPSVHLAVLFELERAKAQAHAHELELLEVRLRELLTKAEIQAQAGALDDRSR